MYEQIVEKQIAELEKALDAARTENFTLRLKVIALEGEVSVAKILGGLNY
jgi:ribosomal protein L29